MDETNAGSNPATKVEEEESSSQSEEEDTG